MAIIILPRQIALFILASCVSFSVSGKPHFAIANLFFQQQTWIQGKVIDEQGDGVAYATLAIKGSSNATLSDQNGYYKIILEKGGQYEVTLSLMGFKSQSKSINVTIGKKLTVDWTFETDTKSLAQIDVTGKSETRRSKEQAYNLNVIEAKKLYNTSADLNQALNKTSGVRIREDGGLGSNFSFSLNGFSGKQIKFFLDGIPMDNFGSSLTLNNIPVNMVERIEIYKGVLPIHLGADALGGGVNVVTRTNPNYTDISYGFGSFNTHKASLNHAYSHAKTGFTYKLNAFYNYSNNNYKINIKPIVNGIRSDEEQEFKRFHDGYESIALQAETGVSEKKYANHLLVGLIASGNQKDIQTGVTMDQVFGARTSESFSLIPTLKYKKTNLFVEGLDLRLYSAYNMTQNQFIDTTRFKYDWFQAKTPTTTAELNRTQLINKDKEALITANLAYRILPEQTVSLNYVMTDFGRKSGDVEDPNNITFKYPQQLNKQVLGLAWQRNLNQLNATIFTKIYLLNADSFEQVLNGTGTPDYRASSTSSTDFGYGMALSYFILPQLQAKASYENAFRLPEAIELLGDGLFVRRNSALKPENSDNINLGVLYTLNLQNSHRLGFEANYLLRNSRDYIRLDQTQSRPVDRQYINIGDVSTHGFEGEVKYLWQNKIQGTINMTYQNIIDKEKFYTSTNLTGTKTFPNLGYGYRIPNTPYLFGNADIGYTFQAMGAKSNTISLNYSVNFVQEYHLTPAHLGANNEDIIPRQLAHNLMANYSLKEGKFNISAECRNLSNNRLYDNYLLQKPGRSIFLKLRYFISKNQN